MSIRVRLTLWYVSLLAGILIALSAGLYAFLSLTLLGQVDNTLEARATEIENTVTATLEMQRDPVFYLAGGGVRLIPSANVFASPGAFVELVLPDGTPVTRSENLGEHELGISADTLDRVVRGDHVYTNEVVNGVPLRVFVSPLEIRRRGVGTETVGAIIVAQSLQSINQTLANLAVLLGVAIIAGLVFAAAVGALLARSALTPIDQVSQTARGITRAGDLTRRIETPRKMDEVGRLVATFNEMLTRIEELFRVQQQFVADVSHELRSPLTSIRGNLGLLARGAVRDNAERAEVLAAINSESERMQRLVTDLLLLAQADEGIKIQRRVVELDTLLLEIYRQRHLTAGAVKMAFDADDQARVMGDPDKLRQLFLNLVDNAIKYTQKGQVKLSLAKVAGWAVVQVADTGMGIPSTELPRIFDRFYRVDKARAREQGGSGLGLAIAKWIVDAHDGCIDVKSQIGKGTTFTVKLPLADR